jgi:hypothetical protein
MNPAHTRQKNRRTPPKDAGQAGAEAQRKKSIVAQVCEVLVVFEGEVLVVFEGEVLVVFEGEVLEGGSS